MVQIWCNTLCNDTHDIHDIARKHTIKLRYQTVFLKLQEISSYLIYKKLCYGRAFCFADRRGRRSLQARKAERTLSVTALPCHLSPRERRLWSEWEGGRSKSAEQIYAERKRGEGPTSCGSTFGTAHSLSLTGFGAVVPATLLFLL